MSSQVRYDRLQVCMNGHVITDLATNPLYREDFCSDCGSPTILDCPECGTPMRGHLIVPGVVGGYSGTAAPAYCHGYGRPFPWTVTRLEAAHELAHELENLDDDEREQLDQSLDDLVADSPRTPLSAGRFKRLMKKAGSEGTNAMREILIDVMSETAKKAIWGSNFWREADSSMHPDQLEDRLRERLDALGPAPRAELLHVLMLPDFERADRRCSIAQRSWPGDLPPEFNGSGALFLHSELLTLVLRVEEQHTVVHQSS